VTGAALANQPAGDHFEDLRYFGITFVGASSAGWSPRMLRRRRYRQAKANTFGFVKRAIHNHRVHPATSAPDSIDMLLRAVDEHGQPLSPDDLIAFTEMIYGNSVRSTTTVCAYAIYALLKHPDLMEKVVAEVDTFFAGGIPDMAAFRQMRWLHAVLLETMRFYPIAVMLPRAVTQDFEFCGYTIKAGQRVFIATTLTHFLPEFFPEPYMFDPARFLEPRHEQRQVGALAPMGLGAHACLGAAAADMVIMTALATLLHTVRLQLDPPDYVLKKMLDPTPVPEDRFAMRVERREA
jgi:cytochrome P450